jgi:hypothetical protein
MWFMHTWLSLVLGISGVIVTRASGAEKVAFAGFAFRGAQAEEASLYPYTSKLLTLEWNQKAVALLKQYPPKHFDLHFDLNDAEQGDTLALGCVLGSETVSVEESGEGHVLRIAMGAEALFIDFKNRSVVASFPFVLRLTSYLERQPDPGEISDRVRLNLEGSGEVAGILQHFVRVTTEARPRARVGATMQVRRVIIEDKALRFLPRIYAENLPALQFWIAQQFGMDLVRHHGVSVLPSVPDAAMGQMELRFKNRAEALNLRIPEASYGVDLSLRGFSKNPIKESASEVAWVYGVYFTTRLYQPLLNKDYLAEDAKEGFTRVVPKAKTNLDDWLGWERALMEFCGEYTMKLGTAKSQKEVKAVLQKCKY